MAADGAASLVAGEVDFILGFGLGLRSRGGGAQRDLLAVGFGLGFRFGRFCLWCERFGAIASSASLAPGV